jgi:hypothetical protein
VGGGKLLLAIKPLIITANSWTTTTQNRHVLIEHSSTLGFITFRLNPLRFTIKWSATMLQSAEARDTVVAQW